MAKRRTTKSKGGRNREVLVVASKVKSYIKDKNMNTSAEAIEAISNRVYEVIDEATRRTSANGRKTLKGYDC